MVVTPRPVSGPPPWTVSLDSSYKEPVTVLILDFEWGSAGESEPPTPAPPLPPLCQVFWFVVREHLCVQVRVREVAEQALCPPVEWPRRLL